MKLYTEHSRAVLLNQTWVWIDFPIFFSIWLFNVWGVGGGVLGHQLLLPRVLWKIHLNHLQGQDQERVQNRPIRLRSHYS